MDDLKPKLSVIICTFNRAASLRQCLASLLQQTFQDFEVILVEAESDEATTAVFNDYSSRLRLKHWVEPTQQLALARDLGWRQARGEILAWIDDDVVVSPDWASSALKILDENPEVAGCSGPTIVKEELLANRDVFFFYRQRGWLKHLARFWNWFFLEGQMLEPGRVMPSGAWTPGANFSPSLQIAGLKEVDFLEACNMILRRNLVARVGGFDRGFEKVAEWSEVDLALRIKSLGYRLVFSSQVLVWHNLSREGVFSARTRAKERMENFLRFYGRHLFKAEPWRLVKFFAYVLFLNFYWLAKALASGNLDWLSGWVGTISGLRYLLWKAPQS